MDSITQAALGAAVGEVVLGKKVGNKATLWGAFGGTLPDLDIFLNPFLTDVQSLVVHRGFSHSIVFALLISPLLGYLVFRISRSGEAGFMDWTKLFFWSVFTHPILDLFTNYGTQWFWPFSDYRIDFSTIFIIDPLYTLPLLITVIWLLFIKRKSPRRMKLAVTGLALSSFYLGLTIFNDIYVSNQIASSLERQEIEYSAFKTGPSPFNNILWTFMVKGKEGFRVGYYSLLDRQEEIDFKYIPDNTKLLKELPETDEIDELTNFSKGFFILQPDLNGLLFNDLRFGTTSGFFDLSQDYIFSFRIKPAKDRVKVVRKLPKSRPSLADMNKLLDRLSGI